MIDNFKMGDITIVSTFPRTVKMFKNTGTFFPKKVHVYMCVKLLFGSTNITSFTARTSKQLVHITWFNRVGNKIFRLNILLSLHGENTTLTFKSLQYLFIRDVTFPQCRINKNQYIVGF